MKKTYIISDYSGFYERIHTEKTYCLLFLMIKYLFKGYRVFSLPVSIVIFFSKNFNIKLPFGTDVTFEKYVKGTKQYTWHSPYDNFY